jgi:hypothetical protein
MIDPNKPIQLEACDWQHTIPAYITRHVDDGYYVQFQEEHKFQIYGPKYQPHHEWVMDKDGVLPFISSETQLKVINIEEENIAPHPVTLRYETEGMAAIHSLLNLQNINDEAIDTFKDCLAVLEKHGFTLQRNPNHDSIS